MPNNPKPTAEQREIAASLLRALIDYYAGSWDEQAEIVAEAIRAAEQRGAEREREACAKYLRHESMLFSEDQYLTDVDRAEAVAFRRVGSFLRKRDEPDGT